MGAGQISKTSATSWVNKRAGLSIKIGRFPIFRSTLIRKTDWKLKLFLVASTSS
jgi:hypothetical protein